jgi:GNAT superfamily N-acetyltransferase
VTDRELAARQHASHLDFNGRLVTRMEHVGGVIAGVTPSVPDRSLPNAVLYEDPAAVIAALPDLTALYADAGVRAWTVWVQPGDDELAAALADAGHAHDGQPMRMAAVLDELDLAARNDLEIRQVDDWGLFGAINDRAYGISGLATVMAGFRSEGARGWLATVDGEAACCVTVVERQDDAYVGFVATVPEFRGRGLCPEVMRHALRVAAEAGCTTTTLEGSPMGEPVYSRMGYRSLGRFGLWERRVSNDSV